MKTYTINGQQVFLARPEDMTEDAHPVSIGIGINAYSVADADKLTGNCIAPYDDLWTDVTKGDGTEEIVEEEIINEEYEQGCLIPQWVTKEYALANELRCHYTEKQAEYRGGECADLLRELREARQTLDDDDTGAYDCLDALRSLTLAAATYLDKLAQLLDELKAMHSLYDLHEGEDYDTPNSLGVTEVVEEISAKISKIHDDGMSTSRKKISATVKAHGYTQRDIAEKMGISPGTLSESINGNPTLSTLRQIAAAVGCTIGELVDE